LIAFDSSRGLSLYFEFDLNLIRFINCQSLTRQLNRFLGSKSTSTLGFQRKSFDRTQWIWISEEIRNVIKSVLISRRGKQLDKYWVLFLNRYHFISTDFDLNRSWRSNPTCCHWSQVNDTARYWAWNGYSEYATCNGECVTSGVLLAISILAEFVAWYWAPIIGTDVSVWMGYRPYAQ
jgi:hypothetical protein